MATEIILPRLGKTMEQATILEIHVQPGDKVKKGQVLADLETDKATMELESPEDGQINTILAEIGWTLPVNTPLFLLIHEEDSISQAKIDDLKEQVRKARCNIDEIQEGIVHTKEYETTAQEDQQARIVSKIRPATGPLEAVKTFQDSKVIPLSEYKLGTRVPLSRWQKVITEKMLTSKRQIPCFYLNLRADVTELAKLRERLNKKKNNHYTYNDFIMKALSLALQRYPILTGLLGNDAIELPETVDIGLAIATDHGLVAPVIRNTDSMNLETISKSIQELIQKAQENMLDPEDLDGGCITISNLGSHGIDSFIPIVIPGQTSIMGVGKICEQCVPADGNILIRKYITLTLSVDHRIVNGAEAAQFLDFVKKQLEHPLGLSE